MVKTWVRHKTTKALLNNGWRLAAVGGGWRLAVGGWRLAVVGPLGLSFRAALGAVQDCPAAVAAGAIPRGKHAHTSAEGDVELSLPLVHDPLRTLHKSARTYGTTTTTNGTTGHALPRGGRSRSGGVRGGGRGHTFKMCSANVRTTVCVSPATKRPPCSRAYIGSDSASKGCRGSMVTVSGSWDLSSGSRGVCGRGGGRGTAQTCH